MFSFTKKCFAAASMPRAEGSAQKHNIKNQQCYKQHGGDTCFPSLGIAFPDGGFEDDMRKFQFWVVAHGLDPVGHGTQRMLVTPNCVLALHYWRALSFLMQEVPMGAVLSRKMVTTDASLIGWGGWCLRGSWGVGL